MNDDSSDKPTSPQPTEWPTSHEARHMARAQRRAEKHAARYAGGGTWLIGVALILLGVIFFLQNMNVLQLSNWWALFILLPAAGSFATAYGAYRNNGGRINATARGSLVTGLILTAVAAFFLFGLDWGKWWPALLILIGVGALLNALFPA